MRNEFLPLVIYVLFSGFVFADETEISLFNGKDLSGWKIECNQKDKDKNYWKVEQGAIVLDTRGQKNHADIWLRTEKEYSDFELTFKVKCMRETKGNSGVQVRSRFLPHSSRENWMHGPQIDLHPADPFRTGLIYDATFGVQRWIAPSLKDWKISSTSVDHEVVWNKKDWNEVTINAEGMRIRTWLNGKPVTDYNGKGHLDSKLHTKLKVGKKGHIALQGHGRNDVSIAFKDIVIREL